MYYPFIVHTHMSYIDIYTSRTITITPKQNNNYLFKKSQASMIHVIYNAVN